MAEEDCGMRCSLIAALVVAVLLGTGADARADATAFIGLSVTPVNRSTRGFALGFGFLIVAFEFEYADVQEQHGFGQTAAPSLRSGMFNGLLQMPFPVFRMQFYVTAGGGVYRERLDLATETNLGVNTGGGVKITLVGPLRVRLDYRVFRLNGQPLYPHPQRLYAGLNLAF
jgi:opacity protein-like surface antigen